MIRDLPTIDTYKGRDPLATHSAANGSKSAVTMFSGDNTAARRIPQERTPKKPTLRAAWTTWPLHNPSVMHWPDRADLTSIGLAVFRSWSVLQSIIIEARGRTWKFGIHLPVWLKTNFSVPEYLSETVKVPP